MTGREVLGAPSGVPSRPSVGAVLAARSELRAMAESLALACLALGLDLEAELGAGAAGAYLDRLPHAWSLGQRYALVRDFERTARRSLDDLRGRQGAGPYVVREPRPGGDS